MKVLMFLGFVTISAEKEKRVVSVHPPIKKTNGLSFDISDVIVYNEG